MTKSSRAILFGASMRLGPAGPRWRAFKIAPDNFVDDAKRRPAELGAGMRPSRLTSRLVSAAVALAMAGAVPAWADTAAQPAPAPPSGKSVAGSGEAARHA